ncbi:hypothetical protein MUK42_37735 [Musa troglodytarum]|uniref:Uncharacterized protein n=1 Tax=Musa troglodytarum TaxID=320322 RepID=A0A9E7K1H6_9LILI|nr:hypothetical protein MUK42_37735 [Musa troglodytarum]
MPAVVEPGSVGSRVRLKEPTADSLAAEVTGNCDRGAAPGGLPMQRFEPREDPSFWKDHNRLLEETVKKKSKLHNAETRRRATERVLLLAIDNLDESEISVQKTMDFGKASKLLKSEEE